MYVCVYVCMYAYMYVFVCMMCVYMCVYECVYVCMCLYAYMCLCIYVLCMYVCCRPCQVLLPYKNETYLTSLSNTFGWIRLIRSPVQPSEHEKLHRCLVISFIYRFHFILLYNPVHFGRCFLLVSPLTHFLLKFESPLHFYPLNSPGRHLQHLSF